MKFLGISEYSSVSVVCWIH